jgi:hypothetical protein
MKKNRYILIRGNTKIGEAVSIKDIGLIVGCTKAHIYDHYSPSTGKNTFEYKKINYIILDKLS